MKAILFLMLLCSTSIFSQTKNDSIVIQGHLINNTRYAKVVIKKFDVGSFDIAAVAIENEKFEISAPSSIPSGVYRFQYSQSNATDYVDLIINGIEKNISFSLDVSTPGSLPVFSASEENKKWYRYIAQSNKKIQKIENLKSLQAVYPSQTDKIIKQVEKTISKEQKNYIKAFNEFCKQNANTWVASMVENKAYYFTNPKKDIRLQDFERKNNFWNTINTTEPKLINTPLYTEHILSYLSYYMNPEMQFSEQEMNEGFIKSLDTIMQKFSGNDTTQKMALQYLQLGFEEVGNEKVLQHIDQKYKALIEQYNDKNDDNTAFDNRMAGYEALAVGNAAPNSTLYTKDTEIKQIYDVVNQKIVLVFWASWCPSCEEQMPELENFAKNNTELSVIAISLDDNQASFTDAIKEYPSMIHSCDYSIWEGNAVSEYYIYGSPTFIVLDKNHKILGKFTSWQQAKEIL